MFAPCRRWGNWELPLLLLIPAGSTARMAAVHLAHFAVGVTSSEGAIGQKEIASSCARGILGWILRETSLERVVKHRSRLPLG